VIWHDPSRITYISCYHNGQHTILMVLGFSVSYDCSPWVRISGNLYSSVPPALLCHTTRSNPLGILRTAITQSSLVSSLAVAYPWSQTQKSGGDGGGRSVNPPNAETLIEAGVIIAAITYTNIDSKARKGFRVCGIYQSHGGYGKCRIRR